MELFGNIGIIGGGNMGSCLLNGLIEKGYPKNHLFLADHGQEKCLAAKGKWQIFTTSDNLALVNQVDILILAVKPQNLKALLAEIAPAFKENLLLISIAAGITLSQIQRWSGEKQPLMIRVMPNTPATLGLGISGIYASKEIPSLAIQKAIALFNCVGDTVVIPEESLMDVVTALSGSGPAYFFAVMEALIKGAQTLGLPQEIARKLTLQTALGSVQMASQTESTLATLRQNVTSKGGTTEAGLNVLKDGKLEALMENTLRAAAARGKFLSEQYD
jgi:pyrroline-5-carboxylate reductase